MRLLSCECDVLSETRGIDLEINFVAFVRLRNLFERLFGLLVHRLFVVVAHHDALRFLKLSLYGAFHDRLDDADPEEETLHLHVVVDVVARPDSLFLPFQEVTPPPLYYNDPDDKHVDFWLLRFHFLGYRWCRRSQRRRHDHRGCFLCRPLWYLLAFFMKLERYAGSPERFDGLYGFADLHFCERRGLLHI